MIVTFTFVRSSAILFPSSGKLDFCNIHHLGRFDIVSPRVFGILSSWVLSFYALSKMKFLWGNGEAFMICVSDGSDTVWSGANIAPPLTENQDVSLYLSHVLPFLALKRASDSG